MGYTTDFSGWFEITPTLEEKHRDYLALFSGGRRMKRDPVEAEKLSDPVRQVVGLPIGVDGGYYVGSANLNFGQDSDPSVLNYNRPPDDQPGLWCQWVPSDDGKTLAWDEGEKFYEYAEWLQYLLDHFLIPWGYELNGDVVWNGEDPDDRGILKIEKNVLRVGRAKFTYEF